MATNSIRLPPFIYAPLIIISPSISRPVLLILQLTLRNPQNNTTRIRIGTLWGEFAQLATSLRISPDIPTRFPIRYSELSSPDSFLVEFNPTIPPFWQMAIDMSLLGDWIDAQHSQVGQISVNALCLEYPTAPFFFYPLSLLPMVIGVIPRRLQLPRHQVLMYPFSM